MPRMRLRASLAICRLAAVRCLAICRLLGRVVIILVISAKKHKRLLEALITAGVADFAAACSPQPPIPIQNAARRVRVCTATIQASPPMPSMALASLRQAPIVFCISSMRTSAKLPTRTSSALLPWVFLVCVTARL